MALTNITRLKNKTNNNNKNLADSIKQVNSSFVCAAYPENDTGKGAPTLVV